MSLNVLEWFQKWIEEHGSAKVLSLQLKSATAENVNLKEKIALLTAELAVLQLNLQQKEVELQNIQKLHEEEIFIWRTVEFRRGRRTFNNWAAFCPGCHKPVDLSFVVVCSMNCGWKSEMKKPEIAEFLKNLEKEYPLEKQTS